VVGRSAQGVRLVRLSEGATLVSVSVCEGAAEEESVPTAENAAGEESLTNNEGESK